MIDKFLTGKHHKESLLSQTEELNAKILAEKKSFVEVQSQYLSESRLRSLAELRVKELEDSILRSREDISILTSKLQEDAKWEREVT